MDEDEPAETIRAAVAAVAAGIPAAAASEDGYLGDCSSDGGNEKNFPIPPDYKYLQSNVLKTSSRDGGESGRVGGDGVVEPEESDEGGGGIEAPAGLAFRNIRPSSFSHFLSETSQKFRPQLPSNSCGYEVILNGGSGSGHGGASRGSSSSGRAGGSGLRKMRSSLKSRLHGSAADGSPSSWSGTWSAIKAGADERKLRLHAGTNNAEKLERILQLGTVNANASDEHGRTALHIAAAKGYAEIVSTLLRHGAGPNQKDSLGNTPLHLAACTNHIQVVTLLLRAGTDVETLDNNGRTPMQLAQSKLKLLQTNPGTKEMAKVKTEVAQVVEMMQEYFSKISPSRLIDGLAVRQAGDGDSDGGVAGGDEASQPGDGQTTSSISQLLDSFSHRLNLHQTHDDINSDLQNLLDSLGNLSLKKASCTSTPT